MNEYQINGDNVIANLSAQIAGLVTQLAIKDDRIMQLEAQLAEQESKNGSGPVKPASSDERVVRAQG